MILRWIVASLHLLALPIGLGAVWARSRALRVVQNAADLPRVFSADNAWGMAAVLWLGTGLIRVFMSLEKSTSYYLHNRIFYVKMGLFLVILLLEIRPMVTLARWRIAVGRGTSIDTTSSPTLARISQIEAAIVVMIVFAATALARGVT
jgi:putative membrane protein